MAYSFGDSFDLYAAPADAINGYWDSGPQAANLSFQTGRFTGSRCIQMTGGAQAFLVKSSNVNDAVHHFVVSFQQTAVITGSNLGAYLELFDGVTAQCSVVFRSDGAILLTSGGPAGTVLDTYTGAFPVINTWYAFEFEVVINNTTGSWAVRKNGNTSNDHALGSLNTRPTSTNNYANKLQVGMNASVTNQQFDDLFWRSDSSSVAWLGDIRCFTRMPASDASVQFSRTPTNFLAQPFAATGAGATVTANNIRLISVASPTSGTVTSLVFNFLNAITGHARMAIYDASGTGGTPGTLMAQTVELTNPVAGLTTFNIVGAPSVSRGTAYWIAVWSDTSIQASASFGIATWTLALTYTTNFPTTAAFASAGTSTISTMGMNVTPFNAGVVNEPQQDGTTSYVYDSTVNDADFYTIGTIASTPATTIAVTTRAYMQKSDAGSRTAAVQIKSGGTTVASPTLTLTTSGWQWAWRMDLTDPATSAAWTAVGVNNCTIGPRVIA